MNKSIFDQMNKLLKEQNIENDVEIEEDVECNHDYVYDATGARACKLCGISEFIGYADGVDKGDIGKLCYIKHNEVSKSNKNSYRQYAIDEFFGITNKPQPELKFENKKYNLNEIITMCKSKGISTKNRYHYFYIANKIKNEKTRENLRLIREIMDFAASLKCSGNINKICFYVYFLKQKNEDVAKLIMGNLSSKNKSIVQKFNVNDK